MSSVLRVAAVVEMYVGMSCRHPVKEREVFFVAGSFLIHGVLATFGMLWEGSLN